MDKIAIKATEITEQTENTIADQKIWISWRANLSTKHSIATDKKAASIKRYNAEAIKEVETNLYKMPYKAVRKKTTKVIGRTSS